MTDRTAAEKKGHSILKNPIIRNHRLALESWTPSEIASHIEDSYFSSEHGWSNFFGESWGTAHSKLKCLPESATEHDILRAIGLTLTRHLPFLHCASCFGFSTTFCNLGRTSATFWVCEKCLDDGRAEFAKRNQEGNFF